MTVGPRENTKNRKVHSPGFRTTLSSARMVAFNAVATAAAAMTVMWRSMHCKQRCDIISRYTIHAKCKSTVREIVRLFIDNLLIR